jgi:hypothetical protein
MGDRSWYPRWRWRAYSSTYVPREECFVCSVTYLCVSRCVGLAGACTDRRYLKSKPDIGPNAPWKYKAINVDIAVDLPCVRCHSQVDSVGPMARCSLVGRGGGSDVNKSENDALLQSPFRRDVAVRQASRLSSRVGDIL